MDLAIALLATLTGFLAALWLLLLWLGDGAMTPEPDWSLDPILGKRDQVAIYDTYEPFFEMPDTLKTHDEMVAWMTKELPKLTADRSKPHV
jgi:hypothetical protein